MATMVVVYDEKTDVPLLAAVSDDASAEYVWPKDQEPWFDEDDRLKMLVDRVADGSEPTTAQGWVDLAVMNLGFSRIGEPVEFPSVSKAKVEARKILDDSGAQAISTDRLAQLDAVSDAYDEVIRDYPQFDLHGVESLDPDQLDAMQQFVLLMLGPIDPDGPNGWFLRAATGEEPRPGDENGYLSFFTDEE